ncbi:hypothetical protein D910_07743 [Dendroctonus ponderosae]
MEAGRSGIDINCPDNIGDDKDKLKQEEYRICWFQLDGVAAYCTQQVNRELFEMFDDFWFGRLGPSDWPARSSDLTPPDFYCGVN